MDTPKAAAEPSSLLRSALKMAGGTLSSRILGLVREILFAAFFGRSVTDAWIAAFRLPNLFRRLLGEGSLAVSFVPVFVSARVEDSRDGGARALGLANSFFTLLCGVLTVVTVAGIAFPSVILHLLLAPTYIADVAKFEMTVSLARIMFGYVFLVTTYAYFMAILNALGSYGWPAFAPVFFNVAMVSAILWPGSPVEALGWGVIAGGVLQVAVLAPLLWRRGFLPRISFGGGREVRVVLRALVPGVIGIGLMQLTTLVNLRFASHLGEGPISWMSWADRLLELPLSLIAVSLGAVLLPSLSHHSARGDRASMASDTGFALRMNLYLCLGAAVGLCSLATPIVEVIFQRGHFGARDTFETAEVLRVWAMIMIPTSCVRILVPNFYAVRATSVPAWVSGACLTLHVVLAPVLMSALGLKGLLISSFVTSGVNFVALLVLYPHFVAPIRFGEWFAAVPRFVPPVVALAAVVQVHGRLARAVGDSLVARVAALALAIFLGAGAYAVVSAWLRLPEWALVWERIHPRRRRKEASRID